PSRGADLRVRSPRFERSLRVKYRRCARRDAWQSKDEGARMKDEMTHWSALRSLSSFRPHPSSFLKFRRGHSLDHAALDLIADLDVVEVLEANAALKTFANFRGVILEAPQRSNISFPGDHAVAY